MNFLALILESIILALIGIFLGINSIKLKREKPADNSNQEQFRVYYRNKEEAFIAINLLYFLAIIIVMITLFAVLPEGPVLVKLLPQIVPILIMLSIKGFIESRF